MRGLLIELVVHWLDCELLKARASGGRGEREKDRDGGQMFPYKREHRAVWSRPHMLTLFHPLLPLHSGFLCAITYSTHCMCVTLSPCLCFSTRPLSIYRSCCSLSEAPSCTMPTTSSSTVASVPTTLRSKRFWREVCLTSV